MPEEYEPLPEPSADQTATPPSNERYLIEEPIGHGGMGQVFRGWDQQLGRRVAIKRVSNEAGVDEAIRREAGILAALHHPNIVTIFDFAADQTGPFVVMELVDGRDLDRIVGGHPMEVSTFLELANQVCRGVSSAHAAGLLHLDLKAGNIMVQPHQDGSFTAKVLDFGLARAREESADPSTGAIYASPHTVSPEQLNRAPLDVRSDVYSLGCVFYYALSGRNPFDASEISDVLRRHLDGVVTPLYLIAPRTPKAMAEAVARMIRVDPNERPQSVEEARRELLKASRAPAPSMGGVASAASRPSAPPPIVPSGRLPRPAGSPPAGSRPPVRPAKRGGGGWIAPLGLLLVAGGGAWWALGPHRPGSFGGSSPQAPAVASPAQEGPAMLDPADEAAFAAHDGQSVVVDATFSLAEENSRFHAVFLKFQGVPVQKAVVSVSQDLMSIGEARSLSGKHFRVTGKCSREGGMNRIVVTSLTDFVQTGQ